MIAKAAWAAVFALSSIAVIFAIAFFAERFDTMMAMSVVAR